MSLQYLAALLPVLLAVYVPTCVPPAVVPSVPPDEADVSELWEAPESLADRDLFQGPWGLERAPDADAVYTFVKRKAGGINPGMTVRDEWGREWKVKQPPLDGRRAEGPVEVVLSRVLSAVGYHQPPVYFLPTFKLSDEAGMRRVPGGRFRLDVREVKARGSWSWQRNPFVGTRPYQGLLVILLLFNSSDIKNSNNVLYEVTYPGEPSEFRYVVRDLGTALGTTGRFTPLRSDPDAFERHGFIKGVRNGFVEFEYRGWHQELVDGRITPEDVRWAGELLAGLTPGQWDDAFRAAGYEEVQRRRFIARILERVQDARTVGLEEGRHD